MKVKKTVLIWLKHVRLIRALTNEALRHTRLAFISLFVYLFMIHSFIYLMFIWQGRYIQHCHKENGKM